MKKALSLIVAALFAIMFVGCADNQAQLNADLKAGKVKVLNNQEITKLLVGKTVQIKSYKSGRVYTIGHKLDGTLSGDFTGTFKIENNEKCMNFTIKSYNGNSCVQVVKKDGKYYGYQDSKAASEFLF